MSDFRYYGQLLTAAFVVVMLISLSFLGVQWHSTYHHELDIVTNKFAENALTLESIVESATDHLHLLQVNAEESLKQTELGDVSLPAELASMRWKTDLEGRYELAPGDNPSEIATGRITGLGNVTDQLQQRGFQRELAMAWQLNLSFRGILENLKEVTWIYYFSARQFANLYPYDPDIRFEAAMMEYSLFTQGLPENNPQRQLTWTEAYLDPAGQGLMVTANAPVYDHDTFLGTIAMDLTLNRLNQVIQDFDYPQGTLLIAGADGQLLAYPDDALALEGEVPHLDTVLPAPLQSMAGRLRSKGVGQIQSVGPYFVLRQSIAQTPWHLVFFVPKAALYRDVIANSFLATLIPLMGLGFCLVATNRLLNYVFIQPACQLVAHLEQESQSATALPDHLPPIWMPWFTSISKTFEENRQLLQTSKAQLQHLKATQLQLVQSEKMSALGNLVAGVAHEINNPIGFVRGNINELRRHLADVLAHLDLYQQSASPQTIDDHADEVDLAFLLEDTPKILASMEKGCDRIRNISTSLRTFSRADIDTKTAFNLHEGIDSTLLILKYRLKANDRRPDIEIHRTYGDIPPVNCFPGQLNQVFMNLLANAIDMFDELADHQSYETLKAHPQRITLTTTTLTDPLDASHSVLISITDNGKGMDAATRDQIFDRQFTTKAVGKGTGLGLAIARQIIVDNHRGRLTVESAPDQGTQFNIHIPVQA